MGRTNIEIRGYKYIYIQKWRDKSWDAKIQRYGDTSIYTLRDGEIHHGIHKYRDTGIQVYIHSEMERYIMGYTNYRDAGIQIYIYIFRDGEINHGMHKYRDTGIQIYIYIQRWRDIGIGEYQMIKTHLRQKFKSCSKTCVHCVHKQILVKIRKYVLLYRTAMLSLKLEIMVNIFLCKEDLLETLIYVITKINSAIFGNNINIISEQFTFLLQIAVHYFFEETNAGFQLYLLSDRLTINFIDIWKTGIQ